LFNFYEDLEKFLLWAPGNLFYGFKHRSQSDYKEDSFEDKNRVIIGHEKFREAQNIYNRLLDFMYRIGYTNNGNDVKYRDPYAKYKMLQNATGKINSDDSLLTEMKEILRQFTHFGWWNTVEPHPVNTSQWEQKRHYKRMENQI